MTTTTQIPVWLDCDPGHDDAFAILLCAHHPSIKLLGVSTVHGNSTLDHTTNNALSLLTAMGSSEVPVYPGAAKSLTRPAIHAPDIHGKSGLDGTDLLPEPAIPAQTDDTIEAMAKALLATPPQSAWLIATGACTNVAILLSTHPEVTTHIKGLSIMGGAIGDNFTSAPMGKVSGAATHRIGNWSEYAEFNILIDPEAASQIFSNPSINKKTILIPLDVTHLVLATKEVLELLCWGEDITQATQGIAKTRLRLMLVELLTFFADRYAEVFGLTAGPPLHDPLAVAAIFDGIPGLEIPFYDFVDIGTGAQDGLGGGVGGKKRRRERYVVTVDTEGTHEDAQMGAETGRTVVTLLGEGEDGVKIPRGLDVGRFWVVVEECLERADQVIAQKSA
ncbi:putative uridine nucleosidase [Amylocarpus encephaloides]|uniref:Uridine nucleosidase n=1 Tax=Amylocarpus encephaloides TaxID=45428 RepID=A0A9P7YPL8_9HELO|nr:putative uridine nucleosidase [Amylocarpus encephaloides]